MVSHRAHTYRLVVPCDELPHKIRIRTGETCCCCAISLSDRVGVHVPVKSYHSAASMRATFICMANGRLLVDVQNDFQLKNSDCINDDLDSET